MLKKQGQLGANGDVNMEAGNQNEEQKFGENMDYEMELDMKDPKSKTMKTGEKYIIRKLVSFKITIPKVDEYISKLEQIKIKDNIMSTGSMSTGVMNSSYGYGSMGSNSTLSDMQNNQM